MELLLNENELLDMGKNISGVKIVCRDGLFWITQAGDNRDHIIRAGQSFTVISNKQLIIMAITPSRLVLTQANRNKSNVAIRLINELCRGTLFANS